MNNAHHHNQIGKESKLDNKDKNQEKNGEMEKKIQIIIN